MRVWVDADDYFAYQTDMKRLVKEALDAADVTIPFSTRTLHIETGPPRSAPRSKHPEQRKGREFEEEGLT